MRKTLALLAFLAVLALPLLARAAPETFGKPLQGLKPTALADVLAKPEAGASVRLEGTIAKVCQNKGCWLVLQQDKDVIHVTFEGYSFFVPKDSAGRKVALEGEVKVETPDPEKVEHMQKEGAGDAVKNEVSVVARGVEIEPAAPPAKP